MPATVWRSDDWAPRPAAGRIQGAATGGGSRNDRAKARKILSRPHALEKLLLALAASLVMVLAGCGGNPPAPGMPPVEQLIAGPGPDYVIGPGDTIQVF